MKEFNNLDVTNACYKCEDRVVGCHSTCEKYKKYKKLMNERNQRIRSQRQLEDSLWPIKPKRKKWR